MECIDRISTNSEFLGWKGAQRLYRLLTVINYQLLTLGLQLNFSWIPKIAYYCGQNFNTSEDILIKVKTSI